MKTAFLLFIVLLGGSPLFLVIDGPLVHGALAVVTAVAVALAGVSMPAGEAEYFAKVFRVVVILLIVPAAWMLIQFLPVPHESLAHPIWASATSALGRPVTGSITIDGGATLLALARYSTIVGIVFVAAAVTIERERAALALGCLVGTTTLGALVLLVHDLGGFTFLGELGGTGARAPVVALCAMAMIVNAAMAFKSIERFELDRKRKNLVWSNLAKSVAAWLAALAICLVALLFFASTPIGFAALTGLAAFVLIVVLRRIGLWDWANYAVAAAAIGVAAVLALSYSATGALTLRYAEQSPASLVGVTERIVKDSNWLGSGAGTFPALLTIYGETENAGAGPLGPTTAAILSIEWGAPAFWVALALAIGCAGWLAQCALQRGRDSFYPATACGCAIVFILEAFCDSSLLTTTVIINAAAILGLGFSQSQSRAVR